MDADVAVIGLGAMGAHALWRLAGRGLSVLGIEQFAPGHPFGSSHGGSRLFRIAALEGPSYVPLGQLAYRMWRELEAQTGAEILTVTGGLMIGRPDCEVVRGTLASARAFDLAHEVLDAGELRSRHPQHVVDDDEVAVTDPDAGVLRPERAIETAARRAGELGATVLTGQRVLAIEPGGDSVTVRMASGSRRVGQVVVGVGAWAGTLLPQLRPRREVRRVVMTWFEPRPDAASRFDPKVFPIFIRDDGAGGGAWGCGTIDGQPVKVGPESYGDVTVDPDALDRATYPADVAGVSDWVARHLPDLDPRPVKVQPCMMGMSPDDQFVVGPHPQLPGVTLLDGLGGHGFKHAAALGEVAAALVAGDGSPVPIEPFAPSRFA